MSIYNLTAIYQPQYISAVVAALAFAPAQAAGAPTVVPNNYNFLINQMRVSNVTGAPVSLTLWRVPATKTHDNEHLVIPGTVNIPTAAATTPWFDVGAMWGVVLAPGDAVWALAGAANALSIFADGAIIQV